MLSPVTSGVAAGGWSFELTADPSNPIDAIRLTMVTGKIKIPVIEFTETKEIIVDPVYLDFTATITDADGDSATSQFSVDLETDDNPALEPDITLKDHEVRILAGDDQPDAFNVDLALAHNQWVVQGFDVGTDTLVLLNPMQDYSIAAGGGDDVVTVGSDTITLQNGADVITDADIVIAFGDHIIDGDLLIGDGGANTPTGTAADDALVGHGGADEMTGGSGADAFVFAEPVAAGDVITDFDGPEGDRIIVSASGFEDDLVSGALSPDQFELSTGAIDADVRFIYNATTGELSFDPDGSGASPAVVFVELSGAPTLTYEDIFVIA